MIDTTERDYTYLRIPLSFGWDSGQRNVAYTRLPSSVSDKARDEGIIKSECLESKHCKVMIDSSECA
jgi:hypothetical protein